MTFDWFLLLTPILLLPLLLLLSFAGCTVGENSYPDLTLILHDSLLLPGPAVTKVHFHWRIEQNGVFLGSFSGFVEDFEVVPGDPGEQIREFRYQPEKTDAGQIWRVTCLPFSGTIGFDVANCGPFELTSPIGEYSVKFEIVADPQGGGRVQVSPDGCPMPS